MSSYNKNNYFDEESIINYINQFMLDGFGDLSDKINKYNRQLIINYACLNINVSKNDVKTTYEVGVLLRDLTTTFNTMNDYEVDKIWRYGSNEHNNYQAIQYMKTFSNAIKRSCDAPFTCEEILGMHRSIFKNEYTHTNGEIGAGSFRTDPLSTFDNRGHLFIHTYPDEIYNAVSNSFQRYETKRNETVRCSFTYKLGNICKLYYDLYNIQPFSVGNRIICDIVLCCALMREGFPFVVTFLLYTEDNRKKLLDAIEYATYYPLKRDSPLYPELKQLTSIVTHTIFECISNFHFLQNN